MRKFFLTPYKVWKPLHLHMLFKLNSVSKHQKLSALR